MLRAQRRLTPPRPAATGSAGAARLCETRLRSAREQPAVRTALRAGERKRAARHPNASRERGSARPRAPQFRTAPSGPDAHHAAPRAPLRAPGPAAPTCHGAAAGAGLGAHRHPDAAVARCQHRPRGGAGLGGLLPGRFSLKERNGRRDDRREALGAGPGRPARTFRGMAPPRARSGAASR